jgi:hypothetical protein
MSHIAMPRPPIVLPSEPLEFSRLINTYQPPFLIGHAIPLPSLLSNSVLAGDPQFGIPAPTAASANHGLETFDNGVSAFDAKQSLTEQQSAALKALYANVHVTQL